MMEYDNDNVAFPDKVSFKNVQVKSILRQVSQGPPNGIASSFVITDYLVWGPSCGICDFVCHERSLPETLLGSLKECLTIGIYLVSMCRGVSKCDSSHFVFQSPGGKKLYLDISFSFDTSFSF